VDRCQLDLHNADGRYSPLNTGSAIYSYISGGGAYHRPMYLEASINGGTNYYRVFTGVIKLPQERTPTPNQIATVSIECRSKDELLLGRRMSTTATSMASANAAGYTEGDVIAAWLTAAGISATVDEGMFVIPWAWMDDESILEEIWQLAAACGGRFYCDPDGTYRFEDVTHWLKSPHATSQETITRDDFTDLTPSYSDTELYSTITVETSPRQAGALDKLWEPDETVIVPPSTTKTMTARLRQPASLINSPTYSAATAGGNDITSSVTVSMTAAGHRLGLGVDTAPTRDGGHALRSREAPGDAVHGPVVLAVLRLDRRAAQGPRGVVGPRPVVGSRLRREHGRGVRAGLGDHRLELGERHRPHRPEHRQERASAGSLSAERGPLAWSLHP
jgi:hypothetical protein